MMLPCGNCIRDLYNFEVVPAIRKSNVKNKTNWMYKENISSNGALHNFIHMDTFTDDSGYNIDQQGADIPMTETSSSSLQPYATDGNQLNRYWSEMGSKFQQYRETSFLCDVELVCNGKSYMTHSVILSAASPFFEGILGENLVPGGKLKLSLEEMDDVVLNIFLDIVYTGRLPGYLSEMKELMNTAIQLKTFGVDMKNYEGYTDTMENLIRSEEEAVIRSEEEAMRSEEAAMKLEAVIKFKEESTFLEQQNNNTPQMKKPKSTTPRICVTCGKVYCSTKNLKRHIREKHLGERPYVCTVCSRSFKQKSSLADHFTRHTGGDSLECKECGKVLRTDYLLRKHQRKKHLEVVQNELPVRYECGLCQRSFAIKHHLKLHMVAHSDDKPYVCCVCLKSFRIKSAFKVHLQLHETHGGSLPSKPFQCLECGSSFKRKRMLSDHLRCHYLVDSFSQEVDTFGQEFYSIGQDVDLKNDIEMSVKRESGKPYSCPICGKEFKRKQTEIKHMQTHIAKRRYMCDICGLRFVNKSQALYHKQQHAVQKPFMCYQCGVSYNTKLELKRHFEQQHRTDYEYNMNVTCARELADNSIKMESDNFESIVHFIKSEAI